MDRLTSRPSPRGRRARPSADEHPPDGSASGPTTEEGPVATAGAAAGWAGAAAGSPGEASANDIPLGLPVPPPATSVLDPRVIQILSTEHWSLLSARGLVYNEAFTRGAMFLTFLSMSFVGIALVAQVVEAGRPLLVIAVVVLAFDVLVSLTTYARILSANVEDFLALRGMARIRHAYGEIAPVVVPLFVAGRNDDWRGIQGAYGDPPERGFGAVVYALSSSGGMIGLIASMLAGLLVGLAVLALDAPPVLAAALGVGAAIAMFVGLVAGTRRYWSTVLDRVEVLYPSPPEASPAPGRERSDSAESPGA